MNRSNNLYYGYRMSLGLTIRTFINSEFIDNLRGFIMKSDTNYFKETDEDFSDFHKLKYFIQDYFNGEFFSLNDKVSPIHLVPIECCGDDEETDWILGIKVDNGKMDLDESSDESSDPEISPKEREMLEEIGDIYQFDFEPDFHYVRLLEYK